MSAIRDDVCRCEGGNCLWKKLCARWLHRLTGNAIDKQMCPGKGTRDEQPYFVEER